MLEYRPLLEEPPDQGPDPRFIVIAIAMGILTATLYARDSVGELLAYGTGAIALSAGGWAVYAPDSRTRNGSVHRLASVLWLSATIMAALGAMIVAFRVGLERAFGG